ncbi:response regulator [Caenispirillum bisanense]|uniref:Hpt domain-containing protein n=1 Tax=Caenispirillum bisanense TaxID=414052 RepID=A0A286G6E8_9PROT|nr:response regulator [Caenispirillum bisanense]SOD91121.1 Hpt domain-containing protein [Caenispirillum bisanense]
MEPAAPTPGTPPSSPLERLTVLLVEDNLYIRDILAQTLRSLGFRKIALARNGEEAVGVLRRRGALASGGQAVLAVDLVISDMVMRPVNGLMLLKWVRQRKESPNRFMPFIMLSGAADREFVEAARDLGADEFLAKPFSVTAVYERLRWVIDHPRPFVCTRDYFGPDRRRHRGAPPADTGERRREGEEHATVVYSGDTIVRPKQAGDVWLFKLPNLMRQKMGLADPGEDFALPKGLLDEAEATLERHAADFHDWAGEYLKRLADAVEGARLVPGLRHRDFEAINATAHELRGEGGTFGYPLITLFAKSLYEATGQGSRQDDAALEVVKAHIDAMRAVIRDRISGDGGETGRELYRTLQQAIERWRPDLKKAEPAAPPPPAAATTAGKA